MTAICDECEIHDCGVRKPCACKNPNCACFVPPTPPEALQDEIPEPLASALEYARLCLDAEESFVFGPRKVIALIEQTLPLLAASRSEQINLWKLVSQYQCNPTGKLTLFEVLRNHLEMSHRACNENYAWAKRTEAELSAARSESTNLREALYGVVNLFVPPSPFYIKKLGMPITNGDQDTIDTAFMKADAALAPVPGSSPKEETHG